MSQKRKSSLIAIQIGLGIVILVLAWFLYDSITSPWEAVLQEQRLTDLTRARMNQVRIALRHFDDVNDRFPGSIDSLVVFVTEDSIASANPDSFFNGPFDPREFMNSARSGARFTYALNDTGRVKVYYLKDPDSDDYIGSIEPDISALHAASWE
ncbi:MAG: hypothetical protein ACC655_04375 [Rhodothermia bacterium]